MKTKIIFVVALISALCVKAQDIKVSKFEINYTSLIARMHPQYDNSGAACAVLRCFVRGKGYTIEPNLGVVKDSLVEGEIILWVPQGTKRITVRHTGSSPLVGYEIPLRIETKTDYNVFIDSVKPKAHNVYVGAGYNVVSISGPSAAIGFNFGGHNIELGAVYGLNKTDDMYYYNQSGNAIAGYNFNAIRAYLKYGYEIPLSDYLSLTPQAGLAYHAYSGKSVINSNDADYKSASSMSLLAGLRFAVSITDNYKFCLTPEYDVAVYKGDNCKLVSSIDDTMKSWHTGFNLNVGIMVYF